MAQQKPATPSPIEKPVAVNPSSKPVIERNAGAIVPKNSSSTGAITGSKAGGVFGEHAGKPAIAIQQQPQVGGVKNQPNNLLSNGEKPLAPAPKLKMDNCRDEKCPVEKEKPKS